MPQSQPTHRVLAVVDDLMFTVKINEAAKRADLPIKFVKTYDDAIVKSKEQPALIVIDLNCQALDGVQLIRDLRASEETRAIPLIGYLSHVQADLIKAAREAGCDTVMPRSAFSMKVQEIFAQLNVEH